MAYQSLEKDCAKASMAKVAMFSVALGAVAGLAVSAFTPAEQLYAPAVTAVRPVVQSSLVASAPFTRLGATSEEVEQQFAEDADVVEFEAIPAGQTQWTWTAFLFPVAAVAGLMAWFKSTQKQQSLDVEQGWAMAASQAEFRSRIQSVKNSKKITDAMKLVASAKLRRAQENVVQSRPFSEGLQGVFSEVIARVEGTDVADDPLLRPRDIKNITLIIIGGDRGLCGSYNNQLIKRSSLRYNELVAQGYNVKCIVIGRKVAAWYKRRAEKFDLVHSYDCASCVPRVPQLVQELISSYLSGGTDTVELLYTNFVSLVKSNPGTRSLLPFKPTSATNMEVDEVCRLTTKDGRLAVECEPGETPKNLLKADMLFEQPAGEILDSLIPLYLSSQLVRTLQESVASELAARMTSMQNASDNAKELGRQLNLQYNRIRQAAVTSSLLEICAGAAAAS